ncbi:MAG: hypothetical protein ACLU38_13600 [Dysosmobacter sp.]
MQLIQTLTLATGSDYASAEINIDWSQWAEVYVVFQLEYKGSMKATICISCPMTIIWCERPTAHM